MMQFPHVANVHQLLARTSLGIAMAQVPTCRRKWWRHASVSLHGSWHRELFRSSLSIIIFLMTDHCVSSRPRRMYVCTRVRVEVCKSWFRIGSLKKKPKKLFVRCPTWTTSSQFAKPPHLVNSDFSWLAIKYIRIFTELSFAFVHQSVNLPPSSRRLFLHVWLQGTTISMVSWDVRSCSGISVSFLRKWRFLAN